jgi:hypothetical protein
MHSDYLFGAPATQFANLYFSPTRQRKMVKDYTESGIKNAAWDMSLVQYWRKAALSGAENDRPVLLISRDKAVRAIATRLVAETEEELFSHIASGWGAKNDHGRQIFERYRQIWDSIENPNSSRTTPTITDITEMTKTMEEQLYSSKLCESRPDKHSSPNQD